MPPLIRKSSSGSRSPSSRTESGRTSRLFVANSSYATRLLTKLNDQETRIEKLQEELVLIQTLIASARHTIHIHSPYFLPDRSMTAELVCAVKERGVDVKVIVPGPSNNHAMATQRYQRPLST